MPQTADSPVQYPARKLVAAWRAHNERRGAFEHQHLGADERAPFVCECTGDDCRHAVSLTMSELAATHSGEGRYAVLPGHVVREDASRVVARHDHFWVVETRAP
jgi:hypothetical protein